MKILFYLLTPILFTTPVSAVFAQDLELPEISSETIKKAAGAVKKTFGDKAGKKKPADKAAKTKPGGDAGSLPPADKPADKKPAKKKKKKPRPASEYKFGTMDNTPTYKFDRRANPIIKEAKPRKKAAKKPAVKDVTPPEDLAPIDGPPIPQKKLPRQPLPDDFVE